MSSTENLERVKLNYKWIKIMLKGEDSALHLSTDFPWPDKTAYTDLASLQPSFHTKSCLTLSASSRMWVVLGPIKCLINYNERVKSVQGFKECFERIYKRWTTYLTKLKVKSILSS